MSKLVERLKILGRGATPIGFRFSGPADQGPPVLVVGELSVPAELSGFSQGDVAGLDAIILTGKGLSVETFRRLGGAVPGLPLGFTSEGMAPDKFDALAAAGADFVVFDLKAPLPVLEAGKLGKFFQLACDTEVARLVAIGELAPVIDGVVLTASGEVITLEYLLACRQAVRLFGVPVLARVPVPVTATELKCLWEAGVDGIVTGDIRSTAALRKAAEALPRGQRRKWGSRPRPVLPGLSGATSDEED